MKTTSGWVCMVVHSGYHAGSMCSPKEPHSGWACGWYWHLLMPATGPAIEIDLVESE